MTNGGLLERFNTLTLKSQKNQNLHCFTKTIKLVSLNNFRIKMPLIVAKREFPPGGFGRDIHQLLRGTPDEYHQKI